MVATDFFGSIGASLATVKRLGQNASLRVGTGTARYTANSTGVIVLNIPVSDNTVNRAIDRIASLSLKRSRASHATVNRLDHWARTGLASAAAGNITCLPLRPQLNITVDRTTESVAIFHFLSVAADLAAEHGLG